MIKIEIKNRFTGAVIFEYSKENNTIRQTVEEAVRQGANLREANLREANLRGANLQEANLQLADLREANLREANLRGANLQEANLQLADLREANLRRADLWEANLQLADLQLANLQGAENTNEAYLSIYSKYSPAFYQGKIKIGCKLKSIKEWDEFFNSDKEYETKRGTEEFERIHAHYLAMKAYYQHLNK